jgi:hypothetical protein
MVLMLGAVLILGFAPTFFLRHMFQPGASQLPPLVVIHGVLGTGWLLLVGLQSQLVRRGNRELHRWAGWIGVVLATAILFSSVLVTVDYVQRVGARLGEAGAGAIPTAFESWRAAIGFTGASAFALLVILGMANRNRPDHHWRYMVGSAVAAVGPAASRILDWWGDVPGPILALTATLFVPVVVHDVRARGRPHAATVVSFLVVGVAGLLSRLPFAGVWLFGS